MAWESPKFSRKAVRRAGVVLATTNLHEQVYVSADDVPGEREEEVLEYLDAMLAMHNWRSSHAYPLNTFQATLRSRAAKVAPDTLIAQRLKRAPSIIAKLQRFPDMDLARMQDIGGCRAVMRNIDGVYALARSFKSGRARHVLEGVDDYIEVPKDDGYRGVHLVYKYVGRGFGERYNGLRIEVQLRSQVQHAWATAVETVGLFRREAIKAGGGDERWRRFFAVASQGFAWLEHGAQEGAFAIYAPALYTELTELVGELDVFARLKRYRDALKLASTGKKQRFYLLALDLEREELTVVGYGQRERARAEAEYAEAEERLHGVGDVVLVSVKNMASLLKAFPNYFADTTLFLDTLREVLGWAGKETPPEWLVEWIAIAHAAPKQEEEANHWPF